MMRTSSLVFAAFASLAPLSALAQDPVITPAPVDVTSFFPTASFGGLFALDTSGVALKKNFGIGAILDFAQAPLVASTGDTVIRVIDNLTQLHLYGFYGFGKSLEASALLPFAVFYSQDLGAGAESQVAKPGDLRLRLKKGLIPAKVGSPLGLALAFEATLPTGAQDSFLSIVGGDSGRANVELTPTIMLEYLSGPVSFNLNLGYAIRKETFLGSASINDRMETGVGLGYTITQTKKDKLQAVIELQANLPVDLGAGAVAAEVPVEARAGARYVKDKLVFQFGAGLGLPTSAGDSESTRGIGAPNFRLFAGAAFAPVTEEDADKDGILGDKDKCPTQAEDKDNFEDENGCPEDDNDKDGILDAADACPIEAEDKDGTSDEDGCIDPDNDGDTLVDTSDKCMNEAEDFDQFEDNDGCPERDNDGDEIADTDDACPLLKGDAALRGCPDTDGDGLTDNVDKCINNAEDKDNFEDNDGCPEDDNDKDGVLDAADACPIQAGTAAMNGCPDTDGDGISDKDDLCIKDKEDGKGKAPKDGCPDTTKAVLRDGKVVILDKIFFDTNKASIKITSNPVLDGVAKVLLEEGNKEIKVRIEGNTDDVGDDAKNQTLSEDRAKAVVAYLVKKGVDASRLQAKGNGETVPLVPVAGLDPVKQKKDLDAAREKNRRVEFFVIE
jgi:outer membrane protein OmpA-like peptidoglycan-associated protein